MNPHLDELIELCKHPKIQERRGEWIDNDRFSCPQLDIEYEGEKIHLLHYWNEGLDDRTCKDCVWIPPLSDPLRPERSLMGMIPCSEDGFTLTYKCCELGEWSIEFDLPNGGWVSKHGPTPEIAVAKAVIAQEEK